MLHLKNYLGELINVRWITKNIGVGITNVDNWQDRVYLSQDESHGKVILAVNHISVLITRHELTTLLLFNLSN